MWHDKRVSVILPTLAERHSIKQAINDLVATGVVDEVIVVDNNAERGTRDEVAQTPARLVHEPQQGYGFALQRGYREATGDLLISSEPDGTFVGHDIIKLLTYSDDVDVVFGTRTTSIMIWSGANMGWFLRLGNYLVAKLIEFSFNTTLLTDCGCTMKLFTREAANIILPNCCIGGSHFGAELILQVVVKGLRFIEIPVNYRKRIGQSNATGSFFTTLRIGFNMIGLLIKFRMTRWAKKPPTKIHPPQDHHNIP